MMQKNNYLTTFNIEKAIKNIILSCIALNILQTIFFIFIFKMFDVAIVYFFTLLFFISVLFSVRRNNNDIAILIMHIAISLNVLYMIFVFGWDYGFQYYFIFLISIYYINSFQNDKVKYFVVSAEIILYLLAYIFMDIMEYNLQRQIVLFNKDLKDFYYVTNCILTGTLIFVFTYLISSNYINFLEEQEESNIILEKDAQKDPLTGLNNRYAFINNIKLLKNNLHKDEVFYFAMVDIDFFKSVNDKYGHSVGDEVLKKLANMMENIFNRKYICRWGGEEFAIFDIERKSDLLDDFSFLNKLEYLKTEFSNNAFMFDKKSFHVTISIGCASVYDIDNIDNTMNLADECLYNSKNTGRNKITYKMYSLDYKEVKTKLS